MIDDLINPITDTMKAYTMDTSHTKLNNALGNKKYSAMSYENFEKIIENLINWYGLY